jgi:hypothetical protein
LYQKKGDGMKNAESVSLYNKEKRHADFPMPLLERRS